MRHRSRNEVHEETTRVKREEDTHINSGVAPVYHENRNQTREYRTTPAENAQYRTEPATYTQPQQTYATTGTEATSTYSQPQYTTTEEYATQQYPTQQYPTQQNPTYQYRNKTTGAVGQTVQDVL